MMAFPLTATAVLITDTLPTGLSYDSQDSGLTFFDNDPILTWQVGDLGQNQQVSFSLVAQVDEGGPTLACAGRRAG